MQPNSSRLVGWIALALGPNLIHGADGAGQNSAAVSSLITGRVLNSATGQYLNNARVSIKGTDIITFTDQYGTYRVVGAPAGTVVMEVFHTGLDTQEISFAVGPGQTVERDIDLTNAARYGSPIGAPGQIVKLDAVTVSSARETDADAIAINEQRFAGNIKNVIAADAYGDVMGTGFNHNRGATVTGNVRYVYDDGTWKLESGFSQSASRYWRRNAEHGFFSGLSAGLRVPVRVTFTGIDQFGPGQTQVFDNNNREIDIYDPNNYIITGATATPLDTRDEIRSASLDLRRQLDFLPFPASLQIGGLRQEQERDTRTKAQAWTYAGPGGDQSAAPFLAPVYSDQVHYYDRSGRGMPWFSPVVAHRAWENNPALFTQTAAQRLTAERDAIRASKYLEETVSALYFQAEARFLQNRLRLLTGVRYERTADLGRGPLRDTAAVFLRNANGTFATNAAGQRIRKTEAGAAGSIEELRLVELERGYVADRTYDGYYPSIHLNHNLTESLVLRLAYARSYGRPDFSDIIPNLISENEADGGAIDDPSQIRGTITVTNTGLKPWTADNYDLSLEYYTKQGGLFSVGLFHKEIADFFGTSAGVATAETLEALGLDSRYLGWQVSTTFNAGAAQIRGVEFNIRQSLRDLGRWGSCFTVFINGTKLNLKGDNQADFEAFIPKSLNWGFTFTRSPFTLVARWNYMGENRGTPVAALGPDVYNFYQFPRATLDVNLDYQFRKNLTLFANAKNIENLPRLHRRYGSSTPDYARQFQARAFGVIFNVGVKGSF